MKWIWSFMVFVILALQVRIWSGEGSFAHAVGLKDQIQQQLAENVLLEQRNLELDAEVVDLKTAQGALEERARSQLGMVHQRETFYMSIDRR
jgi:cell division protein FtsB